jgi:aspartyl/asparaginyl beta-hydroxylase (cupin superfamily)
MLPTTLKENHSLQRSEHFIPGLTSKPWWDAKIFPAAIILERNYHFIKNEFLNLLLCGQLRLHPQSAGGPRRQLANGDWDIFELYSNGHLNLENAASAPHTIRIMQALPEVTTIPSGLVYFSVVNPGVRIAPHCGPTNSRIRIHLGIRIPDGASMRVGEENRPWREGRCSAFDDSWEHEVFNDSPYARAVLLLDVWHPELTSNQRLKLIEATDLRRTKRANERRGWLSSTSPVNSPCLLELAGPSCVDEMIDSAKRACNLGDSVFFVLKDYAIKSKRDSTRVDHQSNKAELNFHPVIWSSLRSLLGRESKQTEEDLVNLLHLSCLLWRSDHDNEVRLRKYFEKESHELRADLSASCHKSIVDVLDWAQRIPEDSAPYPVVVSTAVIAIHGICSGFGSTVYTDQDRSAT